MTWDEVEGALEQINSAIISLREENRQLKQRVADLEKAEELRTEQEQR